MKKTKNVCVCVCMGVISFLKHREQSVTENFVVLPVLTCSIITLHFLVHTDIKEHKTCCSFMKQFPIQPNDFVIKKMVDTGCW